MHAPSDSAGMTPQLCFGEVRHARLRPRRNQFAYRVFFLRLPLCALGQSGFGSRWMSRNRFNLLSFHDRDHGDGKQPLLEWIRDLLGSENIHDADGEIWLQSFPRVLGYVFNPVSFWFCHRADGSLRAIVCEVNNTFGERHCYLLDEGGPIPNGRELTATKAFHVSPFCRIEGQYRFRFLTRFDGGEAYRSVARIDYHDASGPLLNTSISGTAAPADDRHVLKAFFTYPMMTAGVMARIHWQALRLWLRRIPFHVKPEPPASKLTR